MVTVYLCVCSYFFERQEDLWTHGAMKKLPALKASSGATSRGCVGACTRVVTLRPPVCRHAGVR